MWRFAERFGNDLEHIADYRSEEHAQALYRDLSQHPSRGFVCYRAPDGFESPHLWRVWAIGRTTGYPETLLMAAARRVFAEAYITDRRPIGEDWRLFYLEPNGDQVAVLGQEPVTAPPPPPRPYYHVARHTRRDPMGSTTSSYQIEATFNEAHVAQDYIARRPDQGLMLLVTHGLGNDAIMQPVSLAPPPAPEPELPKIRRRAVRI